MTIGAQGVACRSRPPPAPSKGYRMRRLEDGLPEQRAGRPLTAASPHGIWRPRAVCVLGGRVNCDAGNGRASSGCHE